MIKEPSIYLLREEVKREQILAMATQMDLQLVLDQDAFHHQFGAWAFQPKDSHSDSLERLLYIYRHDLGFCFLHSTLSDPKSHEQLKQLPHYSELDIFQYLQGPIEDIIHYGSVLVVFQPQPSDPRYIKQIESLLSHPHKAAHRIALRFIERWPWKENLNLLEKYQHDNPDLNHWMDSIKEEFSNSL